MNVGVVLAGGRGERLGGAKPAADLAGRSLLDRALDALESACAERAVVAKARTPLPSLPDGVSLWIEPADDHHPRHGLVHALRSAGGRPILALAVDLPLVPPSLLVDLAVAVDAGAAAALARADGRAQPLCAAYGAGALSVLERAPVDEALTRTVRRLEPVWIETDESSLCNVNDPADLARASALLSRG